MKEFFLNLLNNLDKLAGLRQIENIYAAHGSQDEAMKEINTLLDLLVNICAQFPYISEQSQKDIIHHCVVTDPEFKSLNARIVYKWLNAQKDKYYKELAHIETEEEHKPIPKDDPRYDEYLKQWQAALKPMEERVNVTARKERLVGHVQDNGIDYTPLSEDDVIKRDRHHRYIRENYDPKTAKPLESWMPEEEWNKIND